MGKKTSIAGYHIVVEPPRRKWFGGALSADEVKDEADRLVQQIKRHVDGFDYVHLVAERESVCEHCGHEWTEKSDTYNGGCCVKDEENAPK